MDNAVALLRQDVRSGFRDPRRTGFRARRIPSSFVVWVTDGIFEGHYTAIAGNLAVDIVLLLALLVLGITLTLGFASKLTTFGMVTFLLAMYTLVVPPADNPIIDDHLLLAVGTLAVYFLGGFDKLSVNGWWKELPLVKRFPILG